jgi:hypothetical protein
MTEPVKSAGGRAQLIVVVTTAVLVLVVAEWASSRLIGERPPEVAREIKRPDNVTIVLKDPAKLPLVVDEPTVWLFGNSHTYALPGLKQGDPLRTDAEGILIDELAASVAETYPDLRAGFYLLAYPNFLPFEILSRVGHLLHN